MFGKITLNNGVRLVYEKIPYVRSVSVGVWVGTGSRREDSLNNGVSHFLEHMLFKGTEKRTAKEIAESIDNIGGQLNAFTSKESTCYYVKILDENLNIALDVLSDMFFSSTLTEADIEVERKVILEEINMYEDSPEELVHDVLSEIAWGGNSLGFPILGTTDTVKAMTRDTMSKYMKDNYRPSNTVIAVAGNFEVSELESMVRSYFDGWKTSKCKEICFYEKPKFHENSKSKWKDTEQIHLCLAMQGIEHGSDELFSLLAVNNTFGGGMSSRIFQKIREEKGLVYSIYSYPSSYKSMGLFTIYAGMNPDCLDEVSELIMGEINKINNEGLTNDEIIKSKEQLKGNYILGLESTGSRMHSIGKSELLMDRIYTPEEVLQKIDNINAESIRHVIDKVFGSGKYVKAMVGNVGK